MHFKSLDMFTLYQVRPLLCWVR